MKKIKYRYLLGCILLLVFIVIALQNTYPHLEVYYYNKQIDVNGVKFLQTESEFTQTLQEKGEFIPGMGGNGWIFKDKQIFIMTSSVGIFKNKVSFIETENPSYRILTIAVGDPFNVAEDYLNNKGFRELNEGIYSKGNVMIQLTGETKVSKIRIIIQDPAYKDVVF